VSVLSHQIAPFPFTVGSTSDEVIVYGILIPSYPFKHVSLETLVSINPLFDVYSP